MVSKEKLDALKRWMEKLRINPDDVIEKFILGSGSGGQKVNKTSSCVYLKHLPSGIEIKCQQTRSRENNRYLAHQELCARIEKQLLEQKQKEKDLVEKKRRQKRRRTKSQQEKVLENKKRRAQVKSLRKPYD